MYNGTDIITDTSHDGHLTNLGNITWSVIKITSEIFYKDNYKSGILIEISRLQSSIDLKAEIHKII